MKIRSFQRFPIEDNVTEIEENAERLFLRTVIINTHTHWPKWGMPNQSSHIHCRKCFEILEIERGWRSK